MLLRWKNDLFSLHTFTQLSSLFAHTLCNDGILIIWGYLIKMKGYLAAGFSNVTNPYHMGEALYGPAVADKVKLKEKATRARRIQAKPKKRELRIKDVFEGRAS